jgi:hypothetical protein
MMTTLTTPLAKEILKEILRLTAGEGTLKKTHTLSKDNRFIKGGELKIMLSFMMKDLKDEFKIVRELKDECRILRQDVHYLRHGMRDNHVECIKLQDDLMKEMSCKYNKDLMKGRLNKEAVNIGVKTNSVSNAINSETRSQVNELDIMKSELKRDPYQ